MASAATTTPRKVVFPILHGIDSPLGAISYLAGLNDLAAADPQGFDPRHEPIGRWITLDRPLLLAYNPGWELVGEHVATLRTVMRPQGRN